MINYDQIWKEKHKKCPWWKKGGECSGNSLHIDTFHEIIENVGICRRSTCPILFWLKELKIGRW